MASVTDPILFGTAINVAHQLGEGQPHKAFTAGIGGFLLMGALVMVSHAVPTLAFGMAILFAIASFLINGKWLINFLTGLVK